LIIFDILFLIFDFSRTERSEVRHLGPPNPWLIVIAKETLGFRWSEFSSDLWLLMPTFSPLHPPSRLTTKLHWVKSAPLPVPPTAGHAD